MKSDFIIIPVHNRCAYTLACLDNLRQIDVLGNFSVIVVDDGSTDGTGEQITGHYPEVILLRGSGSLYWTGAVELGMRYAMEHGAECMVWLNDDSKILQRSIERLVSTVRNTGGIASAITFNFSVEAERYLFPSYHKGHSALVKKEIDLKSDFIPVDACRGNLVAISSEVVRKIGYPDGINIPHMYGDSDYTMRATKAGFPCCIDTKVYLEDFVVIRTDNLSWLLSGQKISELWKKMFQKRSCFYPTMRWIYLTRHWGWRGAIQFPLPYLKLAMISVARLMIPRTLLIRLYGRQSHAWQATAWSRS